MASWNLDITTLKTTARSYTGSQSLNITSLTKSVTTYPALTVSSLSYQQSFTIEAFVYPNVSLQQVFFMSDSNVNNKDLIFLHSNTLYANNATQNAYFSNTVSATVNSWNHMAISYNSTINKVYCAINGTIVSGILSGPLTVTGIKPIDIFWRADSGTDTSQYSTGYIDNIRVSQSCIYTANYTIPDPTTWTVGGTTLFVENFEPVAPVVPYVISIVGPGKYAGLGPVNYGGAFTLEQWVKVTSHQTYGRIFETTSAYIAITYWPGTEYIYLRVNGRNIGSGWSNAILTPNTWVHLAITYSSTGIANAYINGVNKGTITGGPVLSTVSLPVSVYGRDYTGTDGVGYWSGSITEMRIWNTVRTATEIANNYTASLSSSTSGLVVNVTSDLISTCPSSGIITVGVYTCTLYSYSGTAVSDSTLTSLIVTPPPKKLYSFNFNFNESKPTYANIGIGTTNPIKTLDVNGDIRVVNSIYKNNQQLAYWTKTNNDIYYNKGNIGINTTATVKLDINGDVRSKTRLTNSDLRLKYDIEDEKLGLSNILKLTPKVFNYITDPENSRIHGFIAQEVEETEYNDIIDKDSNGYYTINLESLITPLIKSIQDLSTENDILTSKINYLENK